jgi:hypothetical protein
MRTWISFRTGPRGIRAGVSLPNPAARTYYLSATGLKVWRIGSTLMLADLALWLIASRDEEGRLNENFFLVMIMVFAVPGGLKPLPLRAVMSVHRGKTDVTLQRRHFRV